MEELSQQELQAKISVLQERLVSFYAILSDVECEEAKSVLNIQIDNYIMNIELLQIELRKRID